MNIEIDKTHSDALERIRSYEGYGTLDDTVEEMIEDHLLREGGKLGWINNGKYEG